LNLIERNYEEHISEKNYRMFYIKSIIIRNIFHCIHLLALLHIVH